MVQFVFTPWRDRAELLRVRGQLYPRLTLPLDNNDNNVAAAAAIAITPPSPWWSSPEELRGAEAAVARVLMWVNRGGCPHVVESTALLMSAMVFDARGGHDAIAGAAVAAGYLVGFTRFVTGLLDGHQDKARKLSMYGVAKIIGLPAAFVELRHQGTHEPMPSLAQLRPAAARALVWIWEYYWKNLPEEEEERKTGVGVDENDYSIAAVRGGEVEKAGAGGGMGAGGTGKGGNRGQATTKGALEERMCRAALLGYLQRQEDEVGGDAAREGLIRQLGRWEDAVVMKVLAEIGGSARDGGVLLRSVKLSSAILGRSAGPDEGQAGEEKDEEELRRELLRARDEVERGEGMSARGKATGKRKKGDEQDGGEERKRGGWSRWEGQWTTRPIGVL